MKINGFREIPVNTIRFSDKLALRDGSEYTDDQKLDALQKSILNSGLIQPVVVRDLDDGTYELVAGHRRVHAMLKQAHKDGNDPKIMAKVVSSDLTEKEILGIAVEENSMRNDFTVMEFLRVVAMMDQVGFPVNDIITKTGLGEKTVKRMLQVSKDNFFHDMVKNGILKYTQVNALLHEIPEDKLGILRDTVRRWKAATDKKIEVARQRLVNSNRDPRGPTLQHSTYLPSWLIKNWHVAIKEGQETQVDGEWRYGLLYDPETRVTTVPAVRINYDRDPLVS